MSFTDSLERIQKLKKNEMLMINIASTSTIGKVFAVKDNLAKIMLAKPCCVELGDKVSLSRNVSGGYRLIGCGKITHGVPLTLERGTPNPNSA